MNIFKANQQQSIDHMQVGDVTVKDFLLASFDLTTEITDRQILYKLMIDGKVVREAKFENNNGRPGKFLMGIKYQIQKKEPYLLYDDLHLEI